MSKEAMKLALEALESLKVTVSSRTEANVIDGVDLFPTQIAALRQALANEALDKMAENARELGLDYEPSSVSKLAREAGIRDCTCDGTKGCIERFASLVRADERARMAEQLAQQEPVAYLCENAVGHQYFRWKKPSSEYKPIALYTSPPAPRTWVGLSDLNIDELENEYMKSAQTAHEFLRAIEAKLKEKNNG